MVKPGWLEEQFKEVEKDVKGWPDWMRREAGFEDEREKKSASDSKPTPKVMTKSAGTGPKIKLDKISKRV